jgi:DNA-binding transcriptional LysR family regulator
LQNVYAKLHRMPKIDWNDLSIFLEAARAGSFSAAAENGPFNQSTVSRRILSLEAKLGTVLFHRSAQGIALTPVGEAILDLVSEMEDRAKTIEARAAEESEHKGKIRLWVTESVGAYWLPQRMKAFHIKFPEIVVEILCSPNPPAVGTGDVDIALSWHTPEHPDAVVLCQNEMTMKPFASVDYLSVHGIPKTLDELKMHRLCHHLHYPKIGEWKIWSDIVSQAPFVCLQTNSTLALGEAVLNGVGISMHSIGLQAQQPTLRFLDIEGYAPKLKFWLSCHKKMKDIPRVRALINYIKSEVLTDSSEDYAFAVEAKPI